MNKKGEAMSNDYSPGKGCKCEARNESECGGCGADWTPIEVYRLRAELAEVKAKLAAAEAFVAKAAKTADGVPIHEGMELFAADERETMFGIIAETVAYGVTGEGPLTGQHWEDRANRYYSTPEAAKAARAAGGAK
jgi:hypothetical protein